MSASLNSAELLTPGERRDAMAKALNGCSYCNLPWALVQRAKAERLLIVVGESDDIVSLYGVVNDEASSSFMVGPSGIQPSLSSMLEECLERVSRYGEGDQTARKQLTDWVSANSQSGVVTANYPDEHGWSFKTELDHACFEVIEDGDVQCVGIVLALDALGVSANG